MIEKIINFLKSFFNSLIKNRQNSINEELKNEYPLKDNHSKEEINSMKFELKDNKIIFNVSKNKENYSQRNNLFKWVHPKNEKLTMDALSMCNVTSMVMALDYLGYKFPKGKYEQPEDNLCDFMFNNSEVMRYYKAKMPVLYEAFERGDADAYCPNLVHIVLAYATNLWIGCNAVTFKENATISDILKEIILYNRPVVMSGTFPYKYANGNMGTIGHINCLVGTIHNKESQKYIESIRDGEDISLGIVKPESLIVDDPYGSYKQNFAQGTGNDVIYPYADFIKYYKPLNDVKFKMAHIFKNSVSLI